jgi:hypothetical protein
MSSSGELNPIMKGKRTWAIFGFCDVRNFTASAEVLQTSVMTFINKIAEITHSQVNKFGGQPNVNVGDAFMLVWKFQN